jgi:FAD/FMN-containing dehydrogenase
VTDGAACRRSEALARELDPLRIAGAIPGAAVLLDAAGRVEIVPDPTPPRHPTVAGVVLTPATVDALCVCARACTEHGITIEELLAGAREALARWPDVLAAYEVAGGPTQRADVAPIGGGR